LLKLIEKLTVTAIAATIIVTGSPPKPAVAQSQGTVNTIIGAAAVIGGIILYNNYVHRQQAANSIVGYTSNGGTIYGDGRIAMPNGRFYTPNSNGQYANGQYAYYNPNARATSYNYDYQRTGQYDTTHRHGRYVYHTTNVYTTTTHPGNNGIGHAYGHDQNHNDNYQNNDNNGNGHGHDNEGGNHQ